MMMEAVGFRFNPFDEELIDFYLKPEIMATQQQLPCNFIKHRQVYGPCSNPWSVFDSDDWFRSPGLKKTEMCVFVFAKLSKLSRSKSGTWKNTSKRAGCGTWAGKGKQDEIVDCDGNVIGEKRYLVFEINDVDEAGFDVSKVGQYKMYEYSLSGLNSGLIMNSGGTTVLCKIIYDHSKECQINVKSGAKLGCQVSRSCSEPVQEKGENSSNNVEGNLSVLESGAGPVGYDNVEGTSSNLCLLERELDLLATTMWRVLAADDGLDLGDFCEGLNFDDLGGGVNDFCEGLNFDDLENSNNNVQGTSSVNLSVLEESGAGSVGYDNVEGTSSVLTENLSVLESDVGLVGFNNVEGSRSVITENLNVLECGVGPIAEGSAVAQFSDDGLDLGDFWEGLNYNDLGGAVSDFCEVPNFDDLGGSVSFAESGEISLSDWEIDWINKSMGSDPREEPTLDSSSRQLKRKCESEEDLNQSKKMCLDNSN
ncbi:hypothetical protein AgCh_037310 [Apium graveolens]